VASGEKEEGNSVKTLLQGRKGSIPNRVPSEERMGSQKSMTPPSPAHTGPQTPVRQQSTVRRISLVNHDYDDDDDDSDSDIITPPMRAGSSRVLTPKSSSFGSQEAESTPALTLLEKVAKLVRQ